MKAGGFLNFLRRRMHMALKGCRYADKGRLLCWSILDSVPRTVMRSLPYIQKPIGIIKDRLVKRTTIEVNGNLFHCLDSESVLIISPEFEDWMWNHLSLCEGGVFVDVGAHIGKYTIPIAKILGENGLVIAVEPHPENYKTLVENIELNGLKNVVALNIAAWSEERKLRLFIGDKYGHHSVRRNFGLGFIIVQAKALDDVLDTLTLKHGVDCIKIDAEGAELEILKGLQRTLKRYSPKLIVEVSEDLDKVKKFMHEQGYAIKEVAQCYYVAKPQVLKEVE